MVRLISSGRFADALSSTQAPLSLKLRTTQSIVEPISGISATPPRSTLSRTLWRRSCIDLLRERTAVLGGFRAMRKRGEYLCRINVNRSRRTLINVASPWRALSRKPRLFASPADKIDCGLGIPPAEPEGRHIGVGWGSP